MLEKGFLQIGADGDIPTPGANYIGHLYIDVTTGELKLKKSDGTTVNQLQPKPVGRTANATGITTAIIAAGTSFVDVTSVGANDLIVLPLAVLGNVIYLKESTAVGYELVTNDDANVALNNITGAGKELAVGATDTIVCVCTKGGSAGTWVAYKIDNVGAPATAGVPD